MSPDMNNFYACFPGGMYRQKKPYDLTKGHEDIVEGIDRLIEETHFDTGRYKKIEAIRQQCSDKGFELLHDDSQNNMKRAMHLLCRMKKFVGMRDDMVYPIYQKMVERGYDPASLGR